MSGKSYTKGHDTWRRRPTNKPQGPTHVGRWFFTLATLALLVLFVIWFWPGPDAETHLIVISAGKGHLFQSPPLAFLDEDLQAFHDLQSKVEDGKPVVRSASPITAWNGNTSLESVFDHDHDRGHTVLVVYLNAHGIFCDGQAQLLTTQFQLNESGEPKGYVAFRDFLQHVCAYPAKDRVLLLNAGRIPFDRRLGCISNEFFTVVQEDVAACREELEEGETLSVITSNAAGQMARVAYDLRQSVFAHAVVEGLRGGADGLGDPKKSDGAIDLQELFEFIKGSCESMTAGRQTPQLLAADKRKIILVPAKPDEDPPESDAKDAPAQASHGPMGPLAMIGVAQAAPVDPATPPAPPAAPPATTAESPPSANPATPSTTPADAGPSAATKKEEPAPPDPLTPLPLEVRELIKLLDRCWQIRDERWNTTEDDRWSPAEFSPHHGRRFEALLVACEQQLFAGFEYREISHLLSNEVQGARGAVKGQQNTPNIARVDQDLTAFLQSDAHRNWQNLKLKSPEVYDATRELYRSLYRLPYLIDWYVYRSYSAGDSKVFDQIRTLVDALIQLRNQLDEWDQGKGDKIVNVGPVRAAEDALHEALQVDLARQGQQGDPLALLDVAHALLQTPLLAGAERKKLLIELLRASKPDYSAWKNRRGERSFVTERNHAILSQGLLELIRNAKVPWKDFSPNLQGNGGIRESLDKLNRQLRDELRELPQQRGKPFAQRLGRILLDTRDVDRCKQQLFADLAPPQFTGDATQPQIIQRELARSADYHSLQYAVESSPSQCSIRVRPRDNEAEDFVRVTTGDNKTVREATRLPAPVDELRFEFLRQARDHGGKELVYDIIAFDDQDNEVARTETRVRLPLPDRVALKILRQELGQSVPEETVADGITIRPFPNRTTQFQLFLANLTERSQEFVVKVYRVPSRYDTPQRLFQESKVLPEVRSRVFAPAAAGIDLVGSDVKLLATFETGELAAGAERQLTMPPAAPAAPAAGAPIPSPPDKPDVKGGLLCLITDKLNTRQWEQWIEILPQRPAKYVSVHMSSSRADLVSAVLRFAAAGVPASVNDKGAPVGIRIWDDRFEGKRMAPSKELKPEGPESLTSELLADLSRPQVHLDVDGVSRAFRYEIERDRERLVFGSLEGKYHLALGPPVLKPAADAKTDPARPRRLTREAHTWVFPGEPQDLTVGIDVDCDRLRDDQNYLALFDGLSERKKSYHDRVEKVLFTFTAEGYVQLDSTVEDIHCDFPHGDFEAGTEKELRAELVINGQKEREQTIRVLFDRQAPTARFVSSRAKELLPGQRFTGTIEIDDESEIESVYVGLTIDPKAPLEEENRHIPTGAGTHKRFEIVPPDLEPDQKSAAYWVVAEVRDIVGNGQTLKGPKVVVKRKEVKEREKKEQMKPFESGTLRVRVKLSTGKKADSAKVVLNPAGDSKEQTTDPTGYCEFKNVKAGQHELAAKWSASGVGTYTGKKMKSFMSVEDANAVVEIELDKTP